MYLSISLDEYVRNQDRVDDVAFAPSRCPSTLHPDSYLRLLLLSITAYLFQVCVMQQVTHQEALTQTRHAI